MVSFISATAKTAKLTEGDTVSIESGKYRGCILTYVGKVPGWFVCLNSNEPVGFVRVREVAYLRPGPTAAELSDGDVMTADYIKRIKWAKEFSGAQS